MTLQELQVVITAKTSGLKNELKGVNKDLDNLNAKTKNVTNSMASSFKKVAGVVAALGIGKLIADGTNEAIKFEANMATISETLGSNAADFQAWAKNTASSFGISQIEAAKYGNTFSNLVSGFTSDTAQMTSYTTRLLEAAAVVSTKTGKNVEDVLERFRSGMLGSTEAIEDLGIQVKVSTIETTNAFKQIADGKPWASLNAQQQQQILTMAILEQATQKYGDTMAGGPITSMAKLRAELSNLKLALGQAFIPIVTTVLPYLMTFIKYIGTALSYVIAFTQALFGVSGGTGAVAGGFGDFKNLENTLNKTQEDTGGIENNLTGAAGAAKSIKKSLAGIDELNVLSSQDAGDAGGGGEVKVPKVEVPPMDASLNEAIASFNTKIDDMRTKIGDIKESFMEWLPLIAGITTLFAGLWVALNAGKILGVIETIGGWFANLLGKVGLINPALADTFPVWSQLMALISAPVLAIIAIIALSVAALVTLWQTSESFRDSWKLVWKNIVDIVKQMFDTFIKPILGAVVIALLMIWEYGLKPLWAAWLDLWEQISGLITDVLNGAVFPILKELIDWLGPRIVPVVQFLIVVFGTMVTGVLLALTSMIKDITQIVTDLRKIFTGIIDFIKGPFMSGWKGAWDAVKKVFSVMAGSLVTIFKTPLNAIIGMVNAVIKGINSLLSFKVPDWMEKFGAKGGKIGVNIPLIPKLAQGGIVDSGTMFMAGEAGKEVVMPLENNTGWISELAEMLNSRMGSNTNGGDIVLKVGSTEFGRVAIDSINKTTRQEGRLLLQV